MRTQPNILLLFSDQHNAGTLSCAGHPDVTTPHLDRLAASGSGSIAPTVRMESAWPRGLRCSRDSIRARSAVWTMVTAASRTNTTEEPLHLYFTEWQFEFYGRRKENDFFDGDKDSDIIESGVPRKVERVYLPDWKINGLRCTPFHQCNECMKKRLDFVKAQLLEHQIRIDKRDKEYNYEPIEEVFDQELLAPVF